MSAWNTNLKEDFKGVREKRRGGNRSLPYDADEYRKIHFAIMAIEAGAARMGIPGWQMHDRLKAQDLIHNRLLARYDDLHTQSLDWVADDISEALVNWEAERR